jgi:hypothetical protein
MIAVHGRIHAVVRSEHDAVLIFEELISHPDWSFYGPQFPSKEELLAARDRMFAKHPHTTFVALHVTNWPENLAYISSLLNKLPNVMVEFGAREAVLGRQPRRARDLFLKLPGFIPVSQAEIFQLLQTACPASNRIVQLRNRLLIEIGIVNFAYFVVDNVIKRK